MATVVTCFYKIRSKHPFENYMRWIANFMSLPMKTIIYTNQESYQYLKNMYPESASRTYIFREFSEFETSQYDWDIDFTMDHEIHRGHNPLLYMIWNEKPFFMLDALKKNPYGSEYYMWVDIGCFRDESLLPKFQSFPLVSRMNPTKLQFLQVYPFTEEDRKNSHIFDARFQHLNRIGGTMFSCPKDKIHDFANLHKAALTEFSAKGLFKGKDQSLFAFHVLQHPELFECIVRPKDTPSKNDEWFYLQDYMSDKDPLHIVIVGPGIMPIPPTGWGAVEILIWDYAQGLEKLGHKVTIVNDRQIPDCITRIRSLRPDVVHIQYDERASIAEAVRDIAKIILITSHYGYLEQPHRWDSGYHNVFRNIIRQTHQNVYHAVLSEGIARIYKQFGVPESRILVTPNGANAELFEYTETPQHSDRSIYLAKIDYRKRQHIFQNIDGLYYAGNVADQRFNVHSPRYLGEWSKEYLYKNLTNYGNLVLLSDGEADPLVVKEALIAGLGVVISQWSTAGLDLSKPYITVIPEDKIGNLSFVEEAIRKNRECSKQMRAEIRKYGLTFSWSLIIKRYLKEVCGLAA